MKDSSGPGRKLDAMIQKTLESQPETPRSSDSFYRPRLRLFLFLSLVWDGRHCHVALLYKEEEEEEEYKKVSQILTRDFPFSYIVPTSDKLTRIYDSGG